MRVLYSRNVASGTTLTCNVQVPAGATVRRVEVHCITIPLVALGTPDTATANIRVCSIVESDTSDASTWLFGNENVTGYQPVYWQGKLKISEGFNATVYLDIESCTAGNQIELAVTIE